MVNSTVITPIESDVALQAKEKREFLFNFYDNMMKGGDILSVEDIDIVMESLKLAQLDIKEREKRKILEREAALLKQKMAEDEKRRRMAEVRAAKRAERKRKERAAQITAMELPLDYINRYDDDARANVHCDTISEGLLVSLDALGLVDIEFISSVTGEEMKTVIEALKGSIYQNPLHWEECYYKGWETSDEYLSGNLMHKLAIAREANEEYPGLFDDNIKAIQGVINPDLDTDEIYITLGSPWVPAETVSLKKANRKEKTKEADMVKDKGKEKKVMHQAPKPMVAVEKRRTNMIPLKQSRRQCLRKIKRLPRL